MPTHPMRRESVRWSFGVQLPQLSIDDLLKSSCRLSTVEERAIDEEGGSGTNADAHSELDIPLNLRFIAAAAQAAVKLLLIQFQGMRVFDHSVTALLARLSKKQIVVIPILALLASAT